MLFWRIILIRNILHFFFFSLIPLENRFPIDHCCYGSNKIETTTIQQNLIIFTINCEIERGQEYPDSSGTSHLFSGGRRPDTAFQRYRNSRLGGEFHSEITGRSLSECLDECLRQTSFQCRSAVYSDRFRTCRLSRYNQKDGMRIIYDADYDYYENLMRMYQSHSLYIWY